MRVRSIEAGERLFRHIRETGILPMDLPSTVAEHLLNVPVALSNAYGPDGIVAVMSDGSRCDLGDLAAVLSPSNPEEPK